MCPGPRPVSPVICTYVRGRKRATWLVAIARAARTASAIGRSPNIALARPSQPHRLATARALLQRPQEPVEHHQRPKRPGVIAQPALVVVDQPLQIHGV